MLKKLLAFFLVLTLAVTLAPSGAAGWPAAGQTEPFARLEAEREARLAAMAAPFSPAPERSSAAAPAADSSTMGYIVRFRPGMPEAGIERLLGPYDYKMIGPSSLKIFSFHSGQSLAQLESAFAGSVEYIVPDGKSKIQAAPSDTYFGKQWALRTTNVTGAWNISKGSADVLVAVIDSGIKRSHEDFAGRDVKQGWDYLENKAVARDSCGHGTNVTGLIAAATDNARGIAGVCWNVAVLPMLVVDEDGYADTSDICAAVIDAADLDADVINISIGSGDFSQAESDAAAYAIAKGCVVVASAGNDGNDGYNYPASYPGVISAAAVDDASQVADFSNCNDAVDVAAPGVEVLTTADRSIDHQDYIYADGTSFSAPIVAGVAALAKACNPNVNAYMFLDLIKNTSLDRGEQGYDNYYGYGLIDAGKLLERLLTFKTSNGYTYAVSGSSAKILGYAGTDAALNVMGRLGGYPVVSIGEYAFAGNDKMQSLTLPNSLTVIGQRAFYMCRELKTATLGSGLSGLNENVFDACGKLASVAVDAGNPSLSSANGMLYNRDKTRLILCPEGRTGTVAIPAGVTLIGDYAFEDCGLLADVLFPQSLKEIGEGAFLGCGELMAFDIPDSVVKIGWDAFEGTGWYNGRSSPSLVYAGKVAYAYKGVMPYGTRVVLRAGTRGVAAAAFYGCSSLESIT
ncbi:MAG TPA: S8 family serine peptidase, partial [Clostridiales bacterium]|nr:S8 family serine peptidase [Clostridiales bacterium]